MSKLRSFTLILAGVAFIVASVVLFLSDLSSLSHFTSPPPLAVNLPLLAGLGWAFIGLGLGSLGGPKGRWTTIIVMGVSGGVSGILMGLATWIVIGFTAMGS